MQRLTKPLLFILFSIPVMVLAGDINEIIPIETWILEAVGQLATLKGAGAMAIAAFAVQVVMKFFKTELAKFAGKWRLLIVSGLSVVAMIIAGYASGLDFGAIMSASGALATVQVFLNQVWKQFFEKGDEVQTLVKK